MAIPQIKQNQSSTNFDVVIIGAGTAGCSAAINLANQYRVALVDRSPVGQFKIGESLPPASRRLLTDMGLWQDFLKQQHQPCFGNRSIWATDDVLETDFLHDLDGHGWHLDRARFEMWLREQAINRGCQFFEPFSLSNLQKQEKYWGITIKSNQKHIQLNSHFVIDAAGRACPVTRKLGIQRKVSDKLVCGWIVGNEQPTSADAGFSYIEACADGWWYSAPIPDNRRILAFFTDTGIDSTQYALAPQQLPKLAKQHEFLANLLTRCQFQATETTGYNAAHTSRLEQYSGEQWLSVGDAAMSFDPLSSQGLFNALYTGMYAAKAIHKQFTAQTKDFSEYDMQLHSIQLAYQNHYHEWYSLQKKWRNQPFWQNR